MALLLYSDPHYGHANVIRYSQRPFDDAAHMDVFMLDAYRTSVREADTVIWLGDCFFMSFENAEALLRSLPGRKVLVRGNHDRSASRMAAMGFELVADRELRMHIAGRPVRLCHFPYAGTASAEDDATSVGPRGEETVAPYERYRAQRPQRVKGEVLIHGHTHSRVRRNGNQIHVGVDAWGYRPVEMIDVERLIREV